MARWRLTAMHYLNVLRHGERTEWVREETNRDTGRTLRKTFVVPLFLNPDAPPDHNYPGEIIIARPGTRYPNDYIYEGPPTPDMEPLDEEAEAISATERPKWVHPIDSLPGNGEIYSDKLIELLSRQLDEATKAQPAAPSKDLLTEMQNQIEALIKQNATLSEQVAKMARPTVSSLTK